MKTFKTKNRLKLIILIIILLVLAFTMNYYKITHENDFKTEKVQLAE